MPGFSNALEVDVLQYYFGGTISSRPTAWWISLHTADPTDTGTVALVSGNGSSRRQATWATTTSGTAPTIKVSTNAQQWLNMPAVGAPGITHIGIWTLSTGGVYIATGILTTPKVLTAGQTFDIAAGAITLTCE
jgi:hypothetical protein